MITCYFGWQWHILDTNTVLKNKWLVLRTILMFPKLLNTFQNSWGHSRTLKIVQELLKTFQISLLELWGTIENILELFRMSNCDEKAALHACFNQLRQKLNMYVSSYPYARTDPQHTFEIPMTVSQQKLWIAATTSRQLRGINPMHTINATITIWRSSPTSKEVLVVIVSTVRQLFISIWA